MGKSVRILVAEDFERFREFLGSALQNSPGLEIIAEVSNGLDAVYKAEELRPDLILLDVGLPKMNGIDAARRILKISPDSKILFVSEQSSMGVVEETFNAGAHGYLVKSDARRELLEAIRVVLSGEKFLGARFRREARVRAFAWTQSAEATRESIPGEHLHPAKEPAAGARHEMRLYSDDDAFVEDVFGVVSPALKAGNAAILIATESHRDRLIRSSQAQGLCFHTAMAEGRYLLLDAAETLALFMASNTPDMERFMQSARDLIAEATRSLKGKDGRVVACGECAPLLWARGNAEAAIRLEHLWGVICAAYDVDVFCEYRRESFADRENHEVFHLLCSEHSAVLG